MRAEIACEGPLEAADALLVAMGDNDSQLSPWLPGNPEILIDDSDDEAPLATLRYWKEGEIEPCDPMFG